MNFDFSDEQKMFGDQVRRALAQASPLSECRRVLENNVSHSDPAWRALADIGALGAALPEVYGGAGLSAEDLCIAAYEIGYALAPTPFVSSAGMFATAILEWGDDKQKSMILPRVADGQGIGAVALGGAWGGDLGVELRDGKLYGRKSPVLDAAPARHAVVLARDGAEATLALVDLHDKAVEIESLASVDPTRPHSALEFKGAVSAILGKRGAGREYARRLLDVGAVLLAFEQVGAADRALHSARDYALERKAFGQPIGAYQGIKHKLANVYIKNEIARVHAYWGAWALANGAQDLPLAAAGARVAASEALSLAAQENIQTHGGIGFTWESDCQLFYRRARADALVLGSSLRWKEAIVRELEQRNAA